MAEIFIDCPNPDCDDKGRHCSVNTERALWHCVKCDEGGSLIIASTNTYHHAVCEQVLWFDQFTPQRMWLMGRYKLSEETLRAYHIGFDTRYFRWPILGESGDLVGSHRQNPNPTEDEWRWRVSKGSVHSLWPADWVDIQSGDEVVICEGLGDCLLLRSVGVRAFTSTGGANTFPKQWARVFVGCSVTILYDNDKDGQAGARKVASHVSNAGAREVLICTWPESAAPKSDVQSLTGSHPDSYADVVRGLIQGARRWETRLTDLLPEAISFEPPTFADTDIRGIISGARWLEDYYNAVRRSTDAPDCFLVYPSILAISVAVGRRVRIPYAQGLYCNLFLLLLAESTWQRKSTSLDLTRAVVSRVGAAEQEEDVDERTSTSDILVPKLARYGSLLLPHEITPEALYERLQAQPTGLMLVPEMGTQIVRWKKDYQSDMPFLMSDLYDCPEQIIRQTRRSTFHIRYPYLCIGGGVVLYWFRRNFDYQHVVSGWIPRWLLITSAQATDFKEWPEQVNYESIAKLAGRLRSLRDELPANPIQPAEVDGSAITQSYALWSRTIREESLSRHTGELAPMSAIWGRALQIAIKIAVLIELSDSGSLKLTADSWERARRLTEYALQSAEHVLMEQRAKRESTAESWVLRRIRAKPGIILRDINKGPSAQRHGGGEGIRTAIQILLDKGLIKIMEDDRGTPHYFDINAEIITGEKRSEDGA